MSIKGIGSTRRRSLRMTLLSFVSVFVLISALFTSSFFNTLPADARSEQWNTTSVTQVVSGEQHACALADGKLYCWGDNTEGQFGDGTTTDSLVPKEINFSGPLAGKVPSFISASYMNTCGVIEGAAYCWGDNTNGMFGNNSNASSLVPVAVDASGVLAGKTVTSLTMGQSRVCAVASGQAYCWGINTNNGTFGDGTTADSLVPVAVDASGVLAGKTIVSIALSADATCALASDSQVYCWGDGANGKLGNNQTSDSLVPVAVNTSSALSGKTVLSLKAGGIAFCVIASDNQVYCWGSNLSGLLGDESIAEWESSLVPNPVDTSGVLAGKTISELAMGYGHACVIASDQQTYCWGSNQVGQAANGTYGNGDQLSPGAIDTSGALAGKNISKVFGLLYGSCVTSIGKLYCWGYNSHGQVGANNIVDPVLSEPTMVAESWPGISFLSDPVVYVSGSDKSMSITGSGFEPGAVVKFGAVTVDSTVNSSTSISVTVPTAGFTTDTVVDVTVTNPNGRYGVLEQSFTYKIPLEKRVTGVTFEKPAGKQLIHVHGQAFVSPLSPLEYSNAFVRSLVTLNDEQLPVCADGSGYTALQIENLLLVAPGLVSDTPACYYLYQNNAADVVFEATSVLIWVPDSFDIAAEGTVSVNDSDSFAFNTGVLTPDPDPDPNPNPSGPAVPEKEGDDIKKPIAQANVVDTPGLARPFTISADNRSINDTPTISDRPTFSGYAEPFSTVTVAVHSDPVTCTTTADANGYWTCTLSEDLPAGKHQVFVKVQTTSNTVTEFGPYDVTVEQDRIAMVTSDTQTDQPIETRSAFPWLWVGIGAGIFVLIVIIIVMRRTKQLN